MRLRVAITAVGETHDRMNPPTKLLMFMILLGKAMFILLIGFASKCASIGKPLMTVQS